MYSMCIHTLDSACVQLEFNNSLDGIELEEIEDLEKEKEIVLRENVDTLSGIIGSEVIIQF